MLTRRLALSVATAALLTASALPAMAVPTPFFVDFTTIYPVPPASGALSDAQRTFTARWFTDGAGTMTGIQSATFGGVSVTPLGLNSGSYSLQPGGVVQIDAINYSFTPPGGSGLPNPTVTSWFSNTIPGQPGTWVITNVGTPPAPSIGYYHLASAVGFPEINGGVLPKGLFVVAGAFLMFFGRNKRAEA